jgi:hypothetical protein
MVFELKALDTSSATKVEGTPTQFGDATTDDAHVVGVKLVVDLFPQQMVAIVTYALDVVSTTPVCTATLRLPLPPGAIVFGSSFTTDKGIVPSVAVRKKKAMAVARREELRGGSVTVSGMASNTNVFQLRIHPLGTMSRTVYIEVFVPISDPGTLKLPASFSNVLFHSKVSVFPADCPISIRTNLPLNNPEPDHYDSTSGTLLEFDASPFTSNATAICADFGKNTLLNVTVPTPFIESRFSSTDESTSPKSTHLPTLGLILDTSQDGSQFLNLMNDTVKTFEATFGDLKLFDMQGNSLAAPLQANSFYGLCTVKHLSKFHAYGCDQLVLLSAALDPFWNSHPFTGYNDTLHTTGRPPIHVFLPSSKCKQYVINQSNLKRIATTTGGSTFSDVEQLVSKLTGTDNAISVTKITFQQPGSKDDLDWEDIEENLRVSPDPLLADTRVVTDSQYCICGLVLNGLKVSSVSFTVKKGNQQVTFTIPIQVHRFPVLFPSSHHSDQQLIHPTHNPLQEIVDPFKISPFWSPVEMESHSLLYSPTQEDAQWVAELSLNVYSRPTPTNDLSTWSSNFVVSVPSPSGHQVFMALTSSLFSMMRISFGTRLLQDITSKVQNQDVFLEESFNVSREYGIPSNGVSFLLLHDPEQFHRNGVRCPINHPAFPFTSPPTLEEATQVAPKQKIDMLLGIFKRFDIEFVKPPPSMRTFTIGGDAEEVRNVTETKPASKSAQPEAGEMQFDEMLVDEMQFGGMQSDAAQSDETQGDEVRGFLEDVGVEPMPEDVGVEPMPGGPNYRSLGVKVDSMPEGEDYLSPSGAKFRSLSSGGQTPLAAPPSLQLPSAKRRRQPASSQPTISAKEIEDNIMKATTPEDALRIYKENHYKITNCKISFAFKCGIILMDKGVLPTQVSDVFMSILSGKLDDPVLLRSVGFVMMKLELWNDAIDCFEHALELTSAEPVTHIDLALCKFHAYMEGILSPADEPSFRKSIVDGVAHVIRSKWDGKFSNYEIEFPAVVLLSWITKTFSNVYGVDTWPLDIPSEMFFLPKLFTLLGWDTDDVDIDLHIKEPTGQELYYNHPKSNAYPNGGGYITKDITTGFGKEMYWNKHPNAGCYEVKVKYYSNSHTSTKTGSTTAFAFSVINAGEDNEEIRSKVVRLIASKQEEVMDTLTICA